MSWHTEHFVKMAKFSHRRSMIMLKQGNILMYFQAKIEREYFMKMARGE